MGKPTRTLGVADAYTRECVALEADFSLISGRVHVLERVIAEHGRPENMGYGPEFISRRMIGWAEDWNVWSTFSRAGRCRMGTSRDFTAGCATSASTKAGSAP